MHPNTTGGEVGLLGDSDSDVGRHYLRLIDEMREPGRMPLDVRDLMPSPRSTSPVSMPTSPPTRPRYRWPKVQVLLQRHAATLTHVAIDCGRSGGPRTFDVADHHHRRRGSVLERSGLLANVAACRRPAHLQPDPAIAPGAMRDLAPPSGQRSSCCACCARAPWQRRCRRCAPPCRRCRS
jgi:hypothetical protein